MKCKYHPVSTFGLIVRFDELPLAVIHIKTPNIVKSVLPTIAAENEDLLFMFNHS